MTTKLFIGVDGGGTKSRLQIQDEQGNLLGKATGGMASIRISVNRSWESINNALKEAARQAQINLKSDKYELYAGMGLAGCEIKVKVQDFLKRSHPFKKLVLNSDGYCACLGAHDCKDGGIIIIGTGIVGFEVIGRDIMQSSGWGFPQGDEGAGAWLGLEAARYTAQWLDGREEISPLLEAIYAKFNNDWDYFAEWTDAAEATEFATLVPLVVEYVEKQDPHAISLIKRSAHEVDRIFYALRKKAGAHHERINYALFGGVTQFVQPWVCDELKSHLVPRKYDATQGALFMIEREVLGKHIHPKQASPHA